MRSPLWCRLPVVRFDTQPTDKQATGMNLESDSDDYSSGDEKNTVAEKNAAAGAPEPAAEERQQAGQEGQPTIHLASPFPVPTVFQMSGGDPGAILAVDVTIRNKTKKVLAFKALWRLESEGVVVHLADGPHGAGYYVTTKRLHPLATVNKVVARADKWDKLVASILAKQVDILVAWPGCGTFSDIGKLWADNNKTIIYEANGIDSWTHLVPLAHISYLDKHTIGKLTNEVASLKRKLEEGQKENASLKSENALLKRKLQEIEDGEVEVDVEVEEEEDDVEDEDDEAENDEKVQEGEEVEKAKVTYEDVD